MRVLSLSMLSFMWLLACDAPASQAPIVVNCKLDPGNAYCADAVGEVAEVVEVVDETYAPESVGLETSAPEDVADTNVVDTNVADTGAADTRVDTTPTETVQCTTGSTRCIDDTRAQGCVGGAWTSPFTCPNGCANDDCRALPEGDCWSVFACVRDKCYDNNNQRDEACVAACKEGALPNERVEFEVVDACRSDCSGDTWCMIQGCMFEHAACFWRRTGDDDCVAVDTCLGGCGEGDGLCIDDCYEAGTADAQGEHLRVIECLNYICAGQASSCWREQVQPFTACAPFYDVCVGNP